MEGEPEKYEVDIIRDPVTGVVVWEHWCHPDDSAPVVIGGVTMMSRSLVRSHRIGGPAAIRRDPKTGVAIAEGWYFKGRLHRDDGPAEIKRDAVSGRIIYSSWYKHGKLIPKAQRPKLKRQTGQVVPPPRQT